MRLPAAALAAVLLAAAPLAQTPGNCDTGSAERDLDISGVRASLFNTGSLFYGPGNDYEFGYTVPIQRGVSPLFAADLWVAGFVDGDLRVAGATYGRFEFWPGPLDDGATLPDPDDCSAWDRIWVISAEDLARYEDTGEAPADLAEWPVGLGAETVDAGGNPVVPASREQVVDLAAGERPVVFGSQTAFWVMNDVGNEHRSYTTQPIGLEVQVTAFAVVSEEKALDQATFYRYRLVNRNSLPLEDAYLGFFQDPDLGDSGDDFVGSDTTRGLGFTYNEREEDGFYGIPPAFGVDFLDGLGAFYWPIKSAAYPRSFPVDGSDMYNVLQGRWNDGTPITEGGDGYEDGGDTLRFSYPGDPVIGAFWSEENVDGSETSNSSGDRHSISASPGFTLAPGEAMDFHLALIFGQGTDRLESIAEMRAASERVQAAYDDGSLFDTVLPDLPITLAPPTLLAPPNGAEFFDLTPQLEWSAVAGASVYRLEVGTDPYLSNRRVSYSETTSLETTLSFIPDNEIIPTYWRVRAEDGEGGISTFSETRTFVYYRYGFDAFGGGIGITETANPDAEVCPDADDPGCDLYGGNTVWQDPNATDDYVLTTADNDFYGFFGFLRDADTIQGDNFDVRFTAACASPGACLGVYSSILPHGTDLIASVPFEVWNAGAEEDDTDEVRMIPILRAPEPVKDQPVSNWSHTFSTREVVVGTDTLALGITHRVIGAMPDRPNGYMLFEAAANSFGGVGATYDPETDGDEQEEIYTDSDGETSPCRSQRYYVDHCYRNGHNRFVGPLGGLEGFVLADLAEDGTTPAAGTAIRFDANERLLTEAEGEQPTQPQRFALGAAYPNPFRASTTVPFEIGQAGQVRLSVVDVLGREVAVLEDGEVAVGTHRATLNGSRLTSGVYLVVLEADGRRQATKVLLLR